MDQREQSNDDQKVHQSYQDMVEVTSNSQKSRIADEHNEGGFNDIAQALQENDKVDYEEALKRCGGFGLSQYYISFTLILAFLTKSWIIYGMPFLEKSPDYLIKESGAWISCDKDCVQDQICNVKGLQYGKDWKIDYDSPDSYRNWVDPDRLDLTCVKDSTIALPATLYFVGFAISCGIIPPLADAYGRKWTYLLSLIAQTAFAFVIFFSKSLNVTIPIFFFFGVCSGGTVAVGTTYLNEFLPEEKQNLVTTLLNAADASVMITQCIYYIFSRNSGPLFIFGLFYQCSMVLMVAVIPESPKYLYAKKEFSKAKQVLTSIARFNKVKDADNLFNGIKFDTEELAAENVTYELAAISSKDQEDPAAVKLNPSIENPSLANPSLSPNTVIEQTQLEVPTEVGDNNEQEILKLTGSKKELCQVPVIRRNFIILLILLSVSSFCYYCINFQLRVVKGSIITNTLASQIAEMTADFVGGVLYFKMGPRASLSFSYLFSIVGSVALIFILQANNEALIPVFISVAKFGIASSFNLGFIAAMQLIPTLHNASVFGYSNFSARFVTVLAPQVAEVEGIFPLVVNIAMAAVAAIAACRLITKLPKFV